MAQSVARRFSDLKTASNAHFFQALSAHLAGSHDDPCLPMYFNFALSANERGRKAADFIESIVPLKGKRALDVGCAYGGFVVALSERGADSMGIDIDPTLLALAEHNFRDTGRRLPISLADITKAADIASFVGAFDVITCNDVIEHVKDPAVAIEHISTMLRPGGIALFEIPNKDEVCSVVSDGHYQLFGITQLANDRADCYFKARIPDGVYGVEHYLTLPEYRAIFGRFGLSMEVHNDLAAIRSIESVRDSLADLRSSLAAKLETVPPAVRGEVERAVSVYLEEAGLGPTATAEGCQDYLDRYATSFWRVIARKVRRNGSSGTN